MVKNGNLTFLLLELILTDKLADLLTPVESSSGQDWQFHISTFRALILADQLADLCPIEASSGQEW